MRIRSEGLAAAVACLFLQSVPAVLAQTPPPPPASGFPWSNASLSPDQRADMVIQRMTMTSGSCGGPQQRG